MVENFPGSSSSRHHRLPSIAHQAATRAAILRTTSIHNIIMKATSIVSLAALAAIATATPAAARDVALSDCPEAVRSTIEAHARGGRVEEVEQVRVRGALVYIADVELKGGADLHLHVSPAGALVKTVEDLRQADAPEAVRAALRQLGGRVDDLDKVTTGGTVTYHAEIDRPGQADLDVVVSADGRELRQTEDRDD
jgi:uncharacterized membrane protein YkoI